MAVRTLKKAPVVAPGKDVAEILRMGLKVMAAEEIAYGDTSPVSAFKVPANSLVVGLVAEVTQAWNGTGASVTVGVTGTTDRHAAAGDITEASLGLAAVWKPYHYTADATIIVTVVPGTAASTGKIRIWLLYLPETNKAK